MSGSNRLPELAAQISREHDAATVAIKKGIDHALACGDALIEAKALVPHGAWAAWLRDNTSLSERSARRYMQLAKERPTLELKTATVADLTIKGACELIAKPPATPGKAIEAARLVPPEGHCLIACVMTAAGCDICIITPDDSPNYYYVTHNWISDAQDEDGFPADITLTTTRRPVRWQILPDQVFSLTGIDFAARDWQAVPYSGRTDRNPWEPLDKDSLRMLAQIYFPYSPRFRDLPDKPWPQNRRELRQAIDRVGPWADPS